jgi:Flp pilus assembly protein TadG
MVIILPALLLLIFLGIQFALWFHASHVALAAAQEGARAARVTNATDPVSARAAEQAGEDTATRFLSDIDTKLLVKNSVRVVAKVDGTYDRVRVDVTADGVTIVPGFAVKISEHSEGPVERFRPDS